MQTLPNILADTRLLEKYLPEKASFAQRLTAFVRHQLATWPELRVAHDGLQKSLYKRFFLADMEVTLQHNPFRMKSSSAAVDTQSIQKRACFLCPENLYPDQRALVYCDNWLILCNPYPIFPEHLVVTHRSHIPQVIGSCLRAMLGFIAEAGGSFEAFYNGPACGASAPDHLHFQAYPSGGIPLVEQAQLAVAAGMGLTHIDAMGGEGDCWAGELDGRGVFICRSPDATAVENTVRRSIAFLKEATRAPDEPLVNIIIAADGADLIALVLPRRAHRPACYFSQDDDRMLVSPGAVDVGGLLVLPRHEDYERMTRALVQDIFAEVCQKGDIFKGFSEFGS